MHHRIISSKLCLSIFMAAVVGMGHISSAAAALPEVTPEGLKLLPNTKMAAVYMREGADFSGYKRVAILDCVVAFRKNWKRDQNAYSFRVTDSDMTRIKSELAKRLKEVFTAELTAKGTAIATDVAPDVLVLRPAIVNLDIAAPDTIEANVKSFSTSAGQMTLYLDVFDSVTGDLLARVIDPQEATDYGRLRIRNEVTNRQDADRILKKWADTLATYLERVRNGDKTAKLLQRDVFAADNLFVSQ